MFPICHKQQFNCLALCVCASLCGCLFTLQSGSMQVTTLHYRIQEVDVYNERTVRHDMRGIILLSYSVIRQKRINWSFYFPGFKRHQRFDFEKMTLRDTFHRHVCQFQLATGRQSVFPD